MGLVKEKFANYRDPEIAKANNVYVYYQTFSSGQDTEVILNGKKILMFGSNSYLGLTNNPEIVTAAKEALLKYGTGASGSRLLNGNLDLHERLESDLANFVNKPDAAVFSTGFQVNVGTIPSLVGRKDLIVIDEKSHASIIEGCRLAFAKTLKYRHNDMQNLEKILKRADSSQTTLIITDGIFSMEGDIAPLDKICDLAKRYSASVMVDDAHALGVLGKGGTGTASHFGVTDSVELIMGTFSKSLASLGGFVAGDKNTISYLKHNARSLLFSAGIPPASVATVLKALEIIKREPERIDRLWENTHYAIKCLKQANFTIGNSNTPIIPILIGNEIKTYRYAVKLIDEGVYINPVIHPAVEQGKAILRFSLMATHTKEQIDFAVEKLVKCREIINTKKEPENIGL